MSSGGDHVGGSWDRSHITNADNDTRYKKWTVRDKKKFGVKRASYLLFGFLRAEGIWQDQCFIVRLRL